MSIPPTPVSLSRDLFQFLEAMRVAVVGRGPFLKTAEVSTGQVDVLPAASQRRTITAVTAYNAGGAPLTLSAWLVQQGQTTVTPGAQVVSSVPVAAGATASVAALVGHAVPQRATLVMQASAPVSVQVSGQTA